MSNPMSFAKSAAIFLLLVFVISTSQARAQNQTPANLPFVGWTDPDTGLTWTKADNGSDVDWKQATTYCSNLRLGGYSDWRLPTIDELQSIYDPSINIPAGQDSDGEPIIWHVKGNLKLSNGGQWSSSLINAASGDAWIFHFGGGRRFPVLLGISGRACALCVRH